MMRWIALLLLAILPCPPTVLVVRDRFRLIEINHVLNEVGSPVFDQLIYWDWDRESCAFVCQGWRMMPDSRELTLRGKILWDQETADWLEGFGAVERMRLRKRRGYMGEFVGGILLPRRQPNGDYLVRYTDNGVDREIRAGIMRETWTQRDPERDNQTAWPTGNRRGLTPLPKDRR